MKNAIKRKNVVVQPGNTLGSYVVEKKRGKLTLAEILAALKEYDEDIYYIIFDAAGSYQCIGELDSNGDVIEAYKLWALQKAVHGNG